MLSVKERALIFSIAEPPRSCTSQVIWIIDISLSLSRNSRHQDSNLLTSSSFHYTQKVLVSCQVEMFTVYKSCWPKVTTQLPLSRTCPLFQLSTIYPAERGPNIAVFWEDIEGKYCFSTLNCCTMIIFNFNSEPFHCVLLSLRDI